MGYWVWTSFETHQVEATVARGVTPRATSVVPRSAMSDRSAVLVFARAAPLESRLKPLGRGDRVAGASAATLLLQHSVAVAGAVGVATIVAGDEEISRSRLARVHLLLQRGNGFGPRLRNAVADTFALGYRRVVVIGTDTPALSPTLCRKALHELAASDSHTVVLGPSRDGGYYLIGFNEFNERAFAGIPWKTRRVLARTKRALAGCRLVCLPTLTDADDQGSLLRAVGETGAAGSMAMLRRLLAPAPLGSCPWSFNTHFAPLLAALIPVRRGPPVLSFSF